MSKTFRDQYLQDWSVEKTQDSRDFFDVNGMSRRVAVSQPKINMEFRGKAVTIDRHTNGNFRIAIWMPGEAMRTQPLLQQNFTPDDFHRLSYEAAKRASTHSPVFAGGGLGATEAFCVEWCHENYKAILREEDLRSLHGTGWTDMGQWSDPRDPRGPIPTRNFRGEDGKAYVAIDAEKLRREREEKKRKQRAQSELESIPGFGSF